MASHYEGPPSWWQSPLKVAIVCLTSVDEVGKGLGQLTDILRELVRDMTNSATAESSLWIPFVSSIDTMPSLPSQELVAAS